jgi:hypothetical protein
MGWACSTQGDENLIQNVGRKTRRDEISWENYNIKTNLRETSCDGGGLLALERDM